ncbi:MAG TPA: proline--tRNA ligase [Bdellovibrionota bacterium]|nr:proline--tRNA ligase [Bdellovibrionota bacterium]
MAEKITPRQQDFSQWYQDVVIQAKLADYSPVKGCMVIRPNGYAVWQNLQRQLDEEIEKAGAKNAYFPLFIPESFLKKEAEHVEGFAPQCAVVTFAGSKDLEEKLVVRPTSETIINAMFSKWIQSYRDLPLLINQWANVVRWEMRTRLFLRTTEFLWQEGHTCHATEQEAEVYARKILNMYTEFAENVLAMPVIKGLKSESEKFAGALRTYSIEAMMQDKKALQTGTSHNLSSHFAKAFNTKFLDETGKENLVFQTSWGVSTRLIGALIMTHSDDSGFVLPPQLATTHIVIVPIPGPDASVNNKVKEVAEKIKTQILSDAEKNKLSYKLGVHVDHDDTKKPGWKFHEYELIGIPLRIEIGPRDLNNNQVVVARRDNGKKQTLPLHDVSQKVMSELYDMQKDLLKKAIEFRNKNTHAVSSYAEFKKKLEQEGGFFETSWCQNETCETKIKDETKATIRCLLLDNDFNTLNTKEPCIQCGTKQNNKKILLALNY